LEIKAKDVTIHGIGTIYRVSIFKFNAEGNEVLQHSGFGTKPPFHNYIGIILWGPKSQLLIENPKGCAGYGLAQAGIDGCCVLEAGVQTILDRFDEIEDGSNIEVTRAKNNRLYVKIEKGFHW
jgi:hypothetical protein